MVVKMMKWRPWPPLLSKKYEVKVVVRRLEGVPAVALSGNDPLHADAEKDLRVAVEIRWKGPKISLGSFRKTVKRNFTREEGLGLESGVVLWDEEFQTVCSLSGYKENVFHPWEIGFTVLNGLNPGLKSKVPIIGTASLNLAKFASAAEVKDYELNIPLLVSWSTVEPRPSLSVSLSLLELRTNQEPTESVQRPIVTGPSPPQTEEVPSGEKDELSALKAGLRKVKIFTDYVSIRRAKKSREEGSSEGRSEEDDYAYHFDSDNSFDGFEDGESDEVKEDNSAVRKSFSYGSLAYTNCGGGSIYSNKMNNEVDEDWVYYSHRKSDVGCSHKEDSSAPVSEPYFVENSKRSILPWKKRKLNFRSPKAKGEPLLKKGYGDEGGDDIDFDRRQLSSDESLALGWHKTDEDSSANRSSVSEFGDDNFAIGNWEQKEIMSRDGHMKLQTQVFFASIDQRSERASGESACTALVAVIAHWFQNNHDLMPIKSQFDCLIREGSLEWRNLCENDTYREQFPDKHFDLETILQAKIRSLSVVPNKSFIGFFHPDEMEEGRFDFLHGAMSFDSMWDEISHASNCVDSHVYIVSWNDHFFVLKVEPEAYYIVDTLGERLFEGCNQAYILKFDRNTTIYEMPPSVQPISESKRLTDQQMNEQVNPKVGDSTESASEVTEPEEAVKKVVEEKVVCSGKESCKEYIKNFLAAIPIRELQADIKRGLMASTPLHQRLQIEFHYTQLQKEQEAMGVSVNHSTYSLQSSATNGFNSDAKCKCSDISDIKNDLLGRTSVNFGYRQSGDLNDILQPAGVNDFHSYNSERISNQNVNGPSFNPQKGLFSKLCIEELFEGVSGNSPTTSTSCIEDQVSSTAKRRKSGNSIWDMSSLQPVYNSFGPKKDVVMKSEQSLWTSDSYSMNSGSTVLQAKRQVEPPKTTKKKAKPGVRPRPKDRQQILDRMAELRELIPNGEKANTHVTRHEIFSGLVQLLQVAAAGTGSDNKKLDQGKLALAFEDLLRQLWAPGGIPVTPRMFKLVLSGYAPQFTGYNQHDSQEFLAFLLNGLHEDLNHVKFKPYIEVKDRDGNPDEELADEELANECWQNHLAHNDSIIVDLFQGQFRSTLVCPLCKKKSIKFDPFMYLSIPLPLTTMRPMTLTVLSTAGTALPISVNITIPKNGRLKDVVQAVSTSCSLREDETLLLAEISSNRILRFLDKPLYSDSDSIEVIKDSDRMVAYRLPQVSDESSLVVFMHQREELSMQKFGIPLVARMSDLSAGSEIHKRFPELLTPFLIPDKTSVDVSNDGKNAVNQETGGNTLVENDFEFYLESRKSKILGNEPVPDTGSRLINVVVSWPVKMLQLYDTSRLSSILPETCHIPQESVSIYKGIEAFLKEEPLGPDNMWYCPKCKKHQTASKKLDLWRLPEILVVHLKRFSSDHKDKIETFVDFPVDGFDLSSYAVQRGGQVSGHYKLYAVSNHYGAMSSGHYTAFAQHGGDGWFEFDDSRVEPLDVDEIKTCAAYVLFYRRISDV